MDKLDLKISTINSYPKYMLNLLPKYINIYPAETNIIHFIYNNEEKSPFLKNGDIYVIIYTKNITNILKEIHYIFKHFIPIYPVYTGDYLVFTKIMAQQMNLLETNLLRTHTPNIYMHEMGGLLYFKTNNNIIPDYINKVSKSLYIPKYRNTFIEVKENDAKYFNVVNHGWLSLNTQCCLQYCISNLLNNNDNIIELGSWLGRSTQEMLKVATESNKQLNIYCFDKFQNILFSDYTFETPTPLDKFWINTPRYESFCKNISSYINNNKLYTIKWDVNDYINIIYLNFISPSLVFCDAIKNTTSLFNIIEKTFKQYPAIIWVGDDYVINSVKKSVNLFINKYKHINLYITTQSYILTYKQLNKSDIDKYIVKKIGSDPYMQFIYHIENNNLKNALNILKSKKLDINKPLLFCNDNTLYTYLITFIYGYGNTSLKFIQEYILKYIDSNPKSIPNSLYLTYNDYINAYNSKNPIYF